MKVGKFLKIFREGADKSQEEWAWSFGVSPAYVGRVERGETDHDNQFNDYMNKIQFHYDSETLGAVICGIRDYHLQKAQIMNFAMQHGITKEDMKINYV